MRLTPKEKEICKRYSAYDETGYVHCNECPLVIDRRYCVCKKNITKKEYERKWK